MAKCVWRYVRHTRLPGEPMHTRAGSALIKSATTRTYKESSTRVGYSNIVAHRKPRSQCDVGRVSIRHDALLCALTHDFDRQRTAVKAGHVRRAQLSNTHARAIKQLHDGTITDSEWVRIICRHGRVVHERRSLLGCQDRGQGSDDGGTGESGSSIDRRNPATRQPRGERAGG
jgi:hypothetical protein